MIPFLFMRGSRQSEFYLVFNNSQTTETITEADSTGLNFVYAKPGVQISGVKWYVNSGSGDVEAASTTFGATDSTTGGVGFTNGSTGWIGAGTYTCFCTARRVVSGLYDLTSDTGTLTVTP